MSADGEPGWIPGLGEGAEAGSATAGATAALSACAADRRLELKDLPPAVQKAVEQEARGAIIGKIAKEREDGVTQYEIETMRNGKHRDFNVDAAGVLLEVEDETDIAAIPAAARAAILKQIGDGKLGMVELIAKKSGQTSYEAAWTGKSGRKREFEVKPDGTRVKN